MVRPKVNIISTYFEYFEYLKDIINYKSENHIKYTKLLYFLGKYEFYWVIDMDENRDIDALALRKDFLVESGYNLSGAYWDSPRSVLEVLIAFSKRIEMEITGDPGNDDFGRWFWVMIENLGLLKFDNDHFDEVEISKILEKWMSREFKKDGTGSIFLTHKTDIDFRETEMWYQMQIYLNESWQF